MGYLGWLGGRFPAFLLGQLVIDLFSSRVSPNPWRLREFMGIVLGG